LASLFFRSNEQDAARMGITATRKVGNAVLRNRAKRRIREIYRHFPDRAALVGLDLVVHLKPEAGNAPYAELKADLERLLRSAPTRRPETGSR
jgi:ribonuclease P protein component